MKHTDKELYEIALGHFTSNADETIDDVYDNNNWEEVILWQPFENWEVGEVEEHIDNLHQTLIEVRDSE